MRDLCFKRKLKLGMTLLFAPLCLGLLITLPHHEAAADDNKVDDGGFEAGRLAGIWHEKSLLFGTPICRVSGGMEACGTGGGTAGPHDGTYWAWFGGGANYVEKSSLSQKVKFPSGGNAKLRFYLWLGASSPDGKDFLKVTIDGQKIIKVKETNTKYGTYTLVTKNIGQFADGQKHMLRFKNKCSGDGSSNFNVDDVSITVD